MIVISAMAWPVPVMAGILYTYCGGVFEAMGGQMELFILSVKMKFMKNL